MQKYNIQRTDTADMQLNNIILYIAEQFGVETAEEKLDQINDSISLLSTSPYIGKAPNYPILRRQGFRVLILEKNLVFYKVFEESKTVMIYAIVDQRQDYVKIVLGL